MLIRHPEPIPEREVTDASIFLRRRQFLQNAAVGAAVLTAGGPFLAGCTDAQEPPARGPKLPGVKAGPPALATDETPTAYHDATAYNNFYEFGTDKGDPARYAGSLRTEPWSVTVEGEVAKPGVVPLEEILRPHPLEERIYRLRCVEAWSMVIPWVGFPLGDLLKRFEPTSNARYVAFETLHDPEQMPGQKRRVLDWPYREGLRMDEAMHPLAILAVGMYGEALPNQNGAPLRLVVPWKYGFKSIKSIVKIRLQREQPYTSWNDQAPREYGFHANVNPEVDHPRWSQKRERRIGDYRKRPTLPFNGYGEQVASLYAGMDLRVLF
ncbi:MAG: protein-methionine-sulfoxide reductase catalytic subunit MsrP [Proteobacteria bacterium]|nr:protein-methionine-sulfoxide reductase catalytic subunit MsrP [Pseudomonadota bacterium]MCZ6785148.1 protein-methionine-sulfoxide reductase catalytic subunit MsrP [Pseudomonadota bacterium]